MRYDELHDMMIYVDNITRWRENMNFTVHDMLLHHDKT